MRVGTKSVLYGAHALYLHPIAVLVAYSRLYAIPGDPRLLLGILTHDVGYWGMDRVEGEGSENHVELGGRIMDRLCGQPWGDHVRRHSRSWCDLHGQRYSRLCVADKLAFVLTPAWLYLPMARASGELAQYMAATDGQTRDGKFTETERSLLQSGDAKLWLKGLKSYTRRWVEQHRNDCDQARDMKPDCVKKLAVRAATS